MNKTYLALLTKAISFRSVSTDSNYSYDIAKVAQWLVDEFKARGFEATTFKGKTCNTVVFGSFEQNKRLKTVLIYGHYDVQPADIADGWTSDPWKLTQRDGRLFGRGVVDNKGQVLIHMATVFDLIKRKRLAYNVKFLIEGNEETSNPDLADIMTKHKSALACDYVLVSDGEVTRDQPTIDVSLRGGFNATLKVKTGVNALHSGIFGGAVPNAVQELSKLVSKLYTSQNTIAFESFYEEVDEIVPAQISNNTALLSSHEEIVKLAGVKVLLTEPETDFYTQTGLRPTVQLTGIKGGYIGDGYANIVPHEAEARLNFRIVASQKSDKVIEAFRHFVATNIPEYVDYSIDVNGAHNAVKLDTSSELFVSVEKMLTTIYNKPVVKKNVGGAIPFISDVKAILGLDTLSVSLANADCNMHGVDENFRVDLIDKGLEFSESFFSRN